MGKVSRKVRDAMEQGVQHALGRVVSPETDPGKRPEIIIQLCASNKCR